MMGRRAILGLLTTALAAGAGGCATSVSARHTPLYRASAHDATIQVQAANEQVGIEKIEIAVTRGTMTDCSELGGPPSVIPCRSGASTTTYECSYDSPLPSSAICDADLDLGDEELVTYRATAIPGSGAAWSAPEITFAAGEPPTEFIARPVWWHRNTMMATKIDIGLFPDPDYGGDYADFTDDLQSVLTGAFFNPDQPFARLFTLFREVHNLWAGPFGIDAEECSRDFIDEVAPVGVAVDSVAIFHRNEFRDCSSITLAGAGSSGTVWAAAEDAPYVLVHESGHFLHGQGDEYCCDGGYGTAGSCRNVFGSLADCQGYASANGFNPGQCVEIVGGGGVEHTGAWRVADGLDELMRERENTSDWRNTSRQCVQGRYAECADGSCY